MLLLTRRIISSEDSLTKTEFQFQTPFHLKKKWNGQMIHQHIGLDGYRPYSESVMSTKQLHKEWRKNFREGVFARDGYVCKICGGIVADAHHITDRHVLPNGGYVLSNGISLCEACHIKAGVHHITHGIKWPEGFHPNDLYAKIGSSYERAYKDSANLSAGLV